MKELNLTNYDNLGIYDFEEFITKTKGRKIKVQHILEDSVDISKEEEIFTATPNELKEMLLQTTDDFIDMLKDDDKYLLRTLDEYDYEILANEFIILDIIA